MDRLIVELDDEQLGALREYAERRRERLERLIRNYLDYLLAGGTPVGSGVADLPSASDRAALAAWGGALNWLADEPDLYAPDDGVPV